MAKVAHHRMTSKAAKARELCAEIYGVEVASMRKDRPAIHGMYAELEDRGYEWVTLKNEWALTGGNEPAFLPNEARFVFGVQGISAVEGAYLIAEGLKAAGYDVQAAEVIIDADNPDLAFVHMTVKL